MLEFICSSICRGTPNDILWNAIGVQEILLRKYFSVEQLGHCIRHCLFLTSV
jgi:hypothetical protein